MRIAAAFILIWLLLGARGSFAQGFSNLNFESASLPVNTSASTFLPGPNFLPGWTEDQSAHPRPEWESADFPGPLPKIQAFRRAKEVQLAGKRWSGINRDPATQGRQP